MEESLRLYSQRDVSKRSNTTRTTAKTSPRASLSGGDEHDCSPETGRSSISLVRLLDSESGQAPATSLPVFGSISFSNKKMTMKMVQTNRSCRSKQATDRRSSHNSSKNGKNKNKNTFQTQTPRLTRPRNKNPRRCSSEEATHSHPNGIPKSISTPDMRKFAFQMTVGSGSDSDSYIDVNVDSNSNSCTSDDTSISEATVSSIEDSLCDDDTDTSSDSDNEDSGDEAHMAFNRFKANAALSRSDSLPVLPGSSERLQDATNAQRRLSEPFLNQEAGQNAFFIPPAMVSTSRNIKISINKTNSNSKNKNNQCYMPRIRRNTVHDVTPVGESRWEADSSLSRRSSMNSCLSARPDPTSLESSLHSLHSPFLQRRGSNEQQANSGHDPRQRRASLSHVTLLPPLGETNHADHHHNDTDDHHHDDNIGLAYSNLQSPTYPQRKIALVMPRRDSCRWTTSTMDNAPPSPFKLGGLIQGTKDIRSVVRKLSIEPK